jgi:diketogulonate reductase-like aldo/keto reductase
VIGARNEEQLKQNFGALGWRLSPEHMTLLDRASVRPPVYPYWHQMSFDDRNPKPTAWTA